MNTFISVGSISCIMCVHSIPHVMIMDSPPQVFTWPTFKTHCSHTYLEIKWSCCGGAVARLQALCVARHSCVSSRHGPLYIYNHDK